MSVFVWQIGNRTYNPSVSLRFTAPFAQGSHNVGHAPPPFAQGSCNKYPRAKHVVFHFRV